MVLPVILNYPPHFVCTHTFLTRSDNFSCFYSDGHVNISERFHTKLTSESVERKWLLRALPV